MKKEIRTVDAERGIVQITVADERFYVRESTDKITGLPTHEFVPSVTWIAGHYPKSIGFYKWLAQKGWDEAEAIKQAAGNKGSRVHHIINDLLDGETVEMTGQYADADGNAAELSLEEYECAMSFVDWFRKTKPETIARDIVVWNDEYGYAGTVDYICKIDGVATLIDFKTSQDVWPEYEIQVSAYKHALVDHGEGVKLAILQVGYRRNKTKYKFTEIEDQFDLFLAARRIWQKEAAGVEPSRKDYPVALSLVSEPKQDASAPKNGKAAKKAA